MALIVARDKDMGQLLDYMFDAVLASKSDEFADIRTVMNGR
jgi:hypothetical protein